MASRKQRRHERAQEQERQPSAAGWGLRRALAVGALLAVAAAVAYSNSFTVPFVFDDPQYTVENPAIRNLWRPWELIPTRPVLAFTLALNYRLGGFQTGGYHAFNLLVHVLAAWTLFGLVRRTLQGETLQAVWGKHAGKLALAVALLWLVHPLQTQSVTYIIQRGESLMGLFYLLTLYCAVRARGSKYAVAWWLGALVSCALGIGAKQVALTAPILVFLYYWFFFPTAFEGRKWLLWLIVPLGAGCLAAGLWYALRMGHFTAGFSVRGATPWTYALTQSAVLWHYLRLAVLPLGLCLDYGWPVAKSGAEVWPFLVGTLAWLALTAWALLRRHPLGFLGAWFFVILAPTSSFLPIADAAVEHRMYLPLAAVVVLAVLAVFRAGAQLFARQSWTPAERRVVAAASGWTLLAATAFILGVLTFARNRVYESNLTLWSDAAARRPLNARAHSNVGAVLTRLGRPAAARPRLEEALRLDAAYPEAHYNYGVTLDHLGERDKAMEHYRKAFELSPNYAQAFSNYANDLGQIGKWAEAEKYYRHAIWLKPDYSEAYCNLGAALDALGRTGEALDAYRTALKINPDFPEAHCNLGNAYGKLGKNDIAVAGYREAVRLRPDFPEALNNLGVALGRLGQYAEAVPYYERCLKVRPGYAEAHYNLGVALSRLGRGSEAIPQYQEAVQIKPNYMEAQYSLGAEAFKAGLLPLAEKHLSEALRLKPDLTQARQLLEQVRERLNRRPPEQP